MLVNCFLVEENSIFPLFNITFLFQSLKNARHHFIMKIPNKRELLKMTSNHSCDIDFKDFMKLFKEYTLTELNYCRIN